MINVNQLFIYLSRYMFVLNWDFDVLQITFDA